METSYISKVESEVCASLLEVGLTLIEQGKWEKAIVTHILKPKRRFPQDSDGDPLLRYKETLKDFHRQGKDATISIGGKLLTKENIKEYIDIPNDKQKIAFIEGKFAILSPNEEFRHLIIANFNYSGISHSLASVLMLLEVLAPGFSGNTNRTCIFTKIDNSKVHFLSQFTIVKKAGKDQKEGASEVELLTIGTEFDQIWNEEEKTMIVANVRLKLEPKGDFEKFLLEQRKGKELKVINRINITKYASAGLFALLVMSSAAAAFIAHKQNSKTSNLLLSKALGLGAIIMLCVTVTIYIIQNNFYKKSLSSAELPTAESKEQETSYIENLSFDEKFMLLIQ